MSSWFRIEYGEFDAPRVCIGSRCNALYVSVMFCESNHCGHSSRYAGICFGRSVSKVSELSVIITL